MADRGTDGRMLPVGPAERAARVRAAALARWGAAVTDAERFAAAVDYARAAAAAAGRGGVDPTAERDEAIRAAWTAGERLTRALAETEDRDARP